MPAPYSLHKPFVVKQFSINYKHIFSLEYLYRRIHEWLAEEGYCDLVGSGSNSDRWIEKLYLERVSSNGAKQIWIWWRMDKMHPNPFFKFYMNVDFHAVNLVDHEVVVEGTKVKTNKGEVEVFITAKMEIDPEGGWEKNFILKQKYLQEFFLNRIYKDRIEQTEKEMIKETSRLLGAVKQHLQLESWLPEYSGKPFHPAKGE